MNKICGIYKITSPSGKIYIGQSINIKRRIYEHTYNKSNKKSRIYKSILKHGWNAHVFEIIQECQEHELNDLEIYYIKFYNTFNTEHGMNLTEGGNCTKMSEETKKKMSLVRKGRKAWNRGIKHTEETKTKMRLSAPKQHSKEHVTNQANTRRGIKMSEESKLRIGISRKGMQTRLGAKLSDETKEKIFQKKCYLYEIYNNNNELIYEFKSNFNNKMKELKLPQTSFRKSHQNNTKIPNGQYKDWFVVKL